MVDGPVRLHGRDAPLVVEHGRQRTPGALDRRAVDVAVARRAQHNKARILGAEGLAEDLTRPGGLCTGVDEPAGAEMSRRAAAEHRRRHHEQRGDSENGFRVPGREPAEPG
jgi:hypothetical protein